MDDPWPTPAADIADPSCASGRELIGIELRYFLTATLLDRRGPMTVRGLIAALHHAGYTVAGRPSKVISDALRWERAHRRVLRLARGTYQAATRIPPSTIRRIRRRVAALAKKEPRTTRTPPLRPSPLLHHRGIRRRHSRRPAIPPEWQEIERRMGIRRPSHGSPSTRHREEPGLLENLTTWSRSKT